MTCLYVVLTYFCKLFKIVYENKPVTSIVVAEKVLVVFFNRYSYRLFFKGRWLLCWFLTLLFGGCVQAEECRWWKLFVWRLVMLVEGFFMYVG